MEETTTVIDLDEPGAAEALARNPTLFKLQLLATCPQTGCKLRSTVFVSLRHMGRKGWLMLSVESTESPGSNVGKKLRPARRGHAMPNQGKEIES